jgi:hypothetical protein
MVCTNEFLGRSTNDVEDFKPIRKYLEACSQRGKGGMHRINFAKKNQYQLLVLATT